MAAGAPTRPRRSGDPGAETGLSPALNAAVALERPLVMGSAGPGLSSPSLETFEPDARAAPPISTASPATAAMTASAPAIVIPIPEAPIEVVDRVRQHPYVRLALNGSFSALWAGQLISLFGDRLNQLALVAVVAISTGSALATGLVFFAATLPNLLLSPIAGTFVDRWDHKEVMVVSDILRAAIVLVLPLAAVTNIILVYPLIFLVTSISVFFRPARVAILPRIVPEEDLLSANSAMWVGETIADVIGYPLAGLFVALLGSAVPLAFWVDSATYLASAALLATIVVPRAVRSADAARRPKLRRRAHRRLAVPPTRDGAAREHPAGHRRAVQPGPVDRADPELRADRVPDVGVRLAGVVRLPRDRDRAREPDRRVRGGPHRGPLREGAHGHRRIRVVGAAHPPVRAQRQPAASRSGWPSGRASRT